MAALTDMTTEYLELALVTNPQVLVNSVPSGSNLQGQNFPWTLVVGGLLTTPITRQQILNELANRIARDARNPSNAATAYVGPIECQDTINSNGTKSPIGAISAVVAANGAAGGASASNTPGGSSPVPVTNLALVI